MALRDGSRDGGRHEPARALAVDPHFRAGAFAACRGRAGGHQRGPAVRVVHRAEPGHRCRRVPAEGRLVHEGGQRAAAGDGADVRRADCDPGHEHPGGHPALPRALLAELHEPQLHAHHVPGAVRGGRRAGGGGDVRHERGGVGEPRADVRHGIDLPLAGIVNVWGLLGGWVGCRYVEASSCIPFSILRDDPHTHISAPAPAPRTRTRTRS